MYGHHEDQAEGTRMMRRHEGEEETEVIPFWFLAYIMHIQSGIQRSVLLILNIVTSFSPSLHTYPAPPQQQSQHQQ